MLALPGGEETQADISDKVSDFGDKIRERTAKKPRGATGSQGE